MQVIRTLVVKILQIPVDPATLYEALLTTVTASSQNLTLAQPSFHRVPVSADSTDLNNDSSKNTSVHRQQDIVLQTPAQKISDPAKSSTLYEVPTDDKSSNVQQTALVQTAIQLVPIPTEPSTLYVIPEKKFSMTFQTISLSQTPDTVSHEQYVHISDLQTPSNFSEVISVANPSTSTASLDTQTNQFQDDIKLSYSTFSNKLPISAEPSGLYETPDVTFPIQAESYLPSQSPTDALLTLTKAAFLCETSSESHPITVQEVYEPAKLYETPSQPILFPEKQSIQNPVTIDLVPVKAEPPTLYKIPKEGALESPDGRTVNLGKEIQKELKKTPTSFYEVPSNTSEPKTSVAKESMRRKIPYDFHWSVLNTESRSAFSNFQKSDGQNTSGEYRIALPDGRTRIVKFYIDNSNGYHADVTYE